MGIKISTPWKTDIPETAKASNAQGMSGGGGGGGRGCLSFDTSAATLKVLRLCYSYINSLKVRCTA